MQHKHIEEGTLYVQNLLIQRFSEMRGINREFVPPLLQQQPLLFWEGFTLEHCCEDLIAFSYKSVSKVLLETRTLIT